MLEPLPRKSAHSGGRRWENLPADSSEARVLDLAVQVYQAALRRSARARGYFHKRSVPQDVARTQRLGYAAGGTLLRWLRQDSRGDLLPVVVGRGLVQERPGADGNEPVYREFFFERHRRATPGTADLVHRTGH